MRDNGKNFCDYVGFEELIAGIPADDPNWQDRFLARAVGAMYTGLEFRTGRPGPSSLAVDEVWNLLRRRGPHVASKQALRDRLYASWAGMVLSVAPDAEGRYSWLLAENGRKRRTLLAGLGRLREPKLIHWAAGRLCGVQPRTVEGLGGLRDVRQRWRNNERVLDFATWMEQKRRERQGGARADQLRKEDACRHRQHSTAED